MKREGGDAATHTGGSVLAILREKLEADGVCGRVKVDDGGRCYQEVPLLPAVEATARLAEHALVAHLECTCVWGKEGARREEDRQKRGP